MALGKIRLHRDTLANKPATLLQGEMYFATDSQALHIGNGDGTDVICGIVSSGSNANGTYIKYADGTMICHFSATVSSINISTAAGALYISTQMSWTFPEAFYTAPDFSIHYKGASIIWTGDGVATTTALTFYALSAESRTGIPVYPSLIAVGRWKA